MGRTRVANAKVQTATATAAAGSETASQERWLVGELTAAGGEATCGELAEALGLRLAQVEPLVSGLVEREVLRKARTGTVGKSKHVIWYTTVDATPRAQLLRQLGRAVGPLTATRLAEAACLEPTAAADLLEQLVEQGAAVVSDVGGEQLYVRPDGAATTSGVRVTAQDRTPPLFKGVTPAPAPDAPAAAVDAASPPAPVDPLSANELAVIVVVATHIWNGQKVAPDLFKPVRREAEALRRRGWLVLADPRDGWRLTAYAREQIAQRPQLRAQILDSELLELLGQSDRSLGELVDATGYHADEVKHAVSALVAQQRAHHVRASAPGGEMLFGAGGAPGADGPDVDEAAAAPAVASQGPHRVWPVARIIASPFNPRRLFHGIEELAASIKAQGLVEPLICRPIEGQPEVLELVCGECRLRALRLAGIEEVEVIVRQLTDEQAAQQQLAENDNRTTLHPLEEADGLKRLRDKHGRTVREIAAETGLSSAHIYKRLQLCNLVPEVRAAFEQKALITSVAEEIASYKPALQVKALAEVTPAYLDGAPMSLNEALRYLRGKFTLQLVDAPFDRADPSLCPGAGSCDGCSKRSAAQAVLFGELEKDDRCLDADCYGEKKKAAWARAKQEARAAGREAMSPTEVQKLFPQGGLRRGTPYVDLSERVDGLRAGDVALTRAEVLTSVLGGIEVKVGNDKAGTSHVVALRAPLIERLETLPALDPQQAQVLEDLKSEERLAQKSGPRSPDDWERQQALRKLKQERAMEVVLAQLAAVASKAEAAEPDAKLLAFAICALRIDEMVVRRRGWSTDSEKEVAAEVKKLSKRGLWALLLEHAAASTVRPWNIDQKRPVLEQACALLGVDAQEIERKVRAERKAAEKAAKSAGVKSGKQAPGKGAKAGKAAKTSTPARAPRRARAGAPA
jgi:ParB/RepB/Spo0J family partition protein